MIGRSLAVLLALLVTLCRRSVRWGLAVLGFAVAGSAFAVTPQPIYGRLAGPEITYGLDEIIGGATKPGNIVGNTVTRTLARGGNLVKWGGTYVVAPYLVMKAIDYAGAKFTDALNAEARDWWIGRGGFLFEPQTINDYPFQMIPLQNYACNTADRSATYWVARGVYSDGTVQISTYARNSAGAWKLNSWSSVSSAWNSLLGSCERAGERTFADLSPAAQSSFRAAATPAVRDYVRANPEVLRPTLSPAPNPNQWEDSPYADPTADTDLDGVPDVVEWEDGQSGGGGDLNDPEKKPMGAPYETGRETRTTRNPDGSITTTTTVSYSDGKTATTSITTKTDITKNPDGSTTTTKTTTTTSTDREGKTTSKTTTDKKTDPPPDPNTDPKRKTDCIASGGVWVGGTCTSPQPDKTPRETCVEQGGLWDDGGRSCTPPANPDDNAEKKRNCENQGGVWSDAGCVADPEKKAEEDCIKSGGSWKDGACVAPKDEEEKKNNCLSQGGIWDEGTKACTPAPDDQKKKNCETQGGTWDDGAKSCTPAEEDRKEELCKSAGREWDSINKTCGGESEEKKAEKEKEKEATCKAAGREWDSVNKTCGGETEEKKKSDCQAKGGEWNEEKGKCGPKPDPVTEECGNFAVNRLLANPLGWVKDFILPCDDMGDIWKPLRELCENKFPFSLTSKLDHIVTVSGSAGTREGTLPNKIGPFEVDWSFIGPLIATIGMLFKALITFLGVDFILGRLSGQLVIK